MKRVASVSKLPTIAQNLLGTPRRAVAKPLLPGQFSAGQRERFVNGFRRAARLDVWFLASCFSAALLRLLFRLFHLFSRLNHVASKRDLNQIPARRSPMPCTHTVL